MDINKIEELMERGKEKLEQDNIKSVKLIYCPICDEERWDIYDGSSFERDDEFDCWDTHNQYYFYQDFCNYHIESWELNTILKYLTLEGVEDIDPVLIERSVAKEVVNILKTDVEFILNERCTKESTNLEDTQEYELANYIEKRLRKGVEDLDV